MVVRKIYIPHHHVQMQLDFMLFKEPLSPRLEVDNRPECLSFVGHFARHINASGILILRMHKTYFDGKRLDVIILNKLSERQNVLAQFHDAISEKLFRQVILFHVLAYHIRNCIEVVFARNNQLLKFHVHQRSVSRGQIALFSCRIFSVVYHPLNQKWTCRHYLP